MLSEPNRERLTNARYADDMLIFAKSLEELQSMLDLLQVELAYCGLEMHESKSKILTNHNDTGIEFIDNGGLLVGILNVEQTHRYLGRMLST